MFIEWGRRDVEWWPNNCIEYFRPKGDLTVLFQTLQMKQVDEGEGSVFTSDGLSLIENELGRKLPSVAGIAKADDTLVARLLDKYESKMYRSAHKLRDDILNLEEES